MSFNNGLINLDSRRGLKLLTLAAATMLIAVGGLVADTVSKQRDANGRLEISLCEPDGKGGWKVIDKARDNLSLSVSVAQLAAGASKQIESKYVWTARSEKGRQFSVRVARSGNVSLDLTSGSLNLDVPFEVTVDGRKAVTEARLTTGSLPTPLGSISGKRADLQNGALSAELVGVARLRAVLIWPEDVKKSNEEFVVIIRAAGKATARD